MKKDFNEFRFEGLNCKRISNNYITCNRVSADESKIVVRVDDNHLIKTMFGFALILDKKHVVFLKEWAVSQSYYGNEVLLNKDFFIVKEWGEHNMFEENENELKFETWLNTAKEQILEVKWEDGLNSAKKAYNKLKYGF